MNLRQIEYFVRVGELGSFTRASVDLGISQPSLSRQIRQLEVELHQSLLHRNGRGVELTPAGQCFLEHGQGILRSVTRALGELNELKGNPRGRVVIGLPSRVAGVLTTPLVQAFRARFPHASITIAEGLSSVLHDWLVLGRVDIALLVDPIRTSELELEQIHTEELVLVGPRTHRAASRKDIALAQIGKYPLILPRTPNATRAVLESATGKAGVQIRISTEVDTTQSILQLVAKKMGYAILPRGAVLNAGGEAHFQITSITPTIEQHVFLALSRTRPMGQLVSAVRQLIREANIPRLLG